MSEKIEEILENRDIKITFLNGLKSGLNTTWLLSKIIIPVYFIVTLFKYTGILNWISIKFAPIMGIFGLPGEAALALVSGNLINLFAALSVIANLTLTTKQVTILAIMLSFSHSLFMETAVAKKTGISVIIVLMIRFSLAILSGIILNMVI